MTTDDLRPSGRTGYTPFEAELVSVINDFADTANAPAFDTGAIVRRARRKRATAAAGVATALALAGGGTTLAVATSGSHAAAPAAAAAASTAEGGSSQDTTVLFDDNGAVVRIELGGVNLAVGTMELSGKAGIKVGTSRQKDCHGGRPGSVVKASPHSPTVMSPGDTVYLTYCTG